MGAETKSKVIWLTLCDCVEHVLWGILQFNQYFGRRDRHSLTGPNVEWNARPSPCVDVKPDSRECLYLRIPSHAFLVAVPLELAADHIGGNERPHGSKSSLLLVPQAIGFATNWC